MHGRLTVLLAALAMSSVPQSAIAQARGTVGSRLHGPTAVPRPLPSRPSPPPTTTAVPFRSTMIVTPTPVPAPAHRALPVRLSGFGLVLFDPYWWTNRDQAFAPSPLPGDGRPTGGLQLDVEPRHALVYVDGWHVGTVDTFSGYYHHLDLAAGQHRIELVASDYDPLIVDVTVTPGRTTTYRGWLNRR